VTAPILKENKKKVGQPIEKKREDCSAEEKKKIWGTEIKTLGEKEIESRDARSSFFYPEGGRPT